MAGSLFSRNHKFSMDERSRIGFCVLPFSVKVPPLKRPRHEFFCFSLGWMQGNRSVSGRSICPGCLAYESGFINIKSWAGSSMSNVHNLFGALAKKLSQIYEGSFPRVYFFCHFPPAYRMGAGSIFRDAMASKADDTRTEGIFDK
jgi:hypothetical protein